MNYSFIAYIFICIVIGLGTFSTLIKADRMYSAILSLILFVLIFVFYGLRWFSGETSRFSYSGAWPPVINMCPDYLVYFKKGVQDTCVDLIGVNRSGGTLKPWTKEDNPSNPPEDENKYFRFVYKPGMTPEQLKTLCDAAQSAGVTWEGITNGESCTYGK